MNVLSLFDGISCGRLALERAEIPVTNYYASEIDKYAISISQYNYPDIIRLGDVTKWREWDLDFSKIDLLIGGSPCQSFSISGNGLGFDGSSGLIQFYFDILEHIQSINPNVKFLLENVKMKKEWMNIISEKLGVQPTLINSALLSSQSRSRLYWANFPITLPEDKKILLKDILQPESEVDVKYFLSQKLVEGFRRKEEVNRHKKRGFDKLNIRSENDKASCLTARMAKMGATDNYISSTSRLGDIGNGGQGQRVYDIEGKSVTLSALGGGEGAKTGLYLTKLASLPANIRKDIVKNNADMPEDVDIKVKEGQFIYTNHLGQNGSLVKDKCATLVCASQAHCVTNDLGIRKLTPIEAERCQTLLDNYTQKGINSNNKEVLISDSQRYKVLGNGWTIDIITHILKGILKEATCY
jgi:DNA (cytosine-5)-methyltransferase 3A